MSFIEDIEKLTSRGFIKFLCIILFITPGAAVIFYYQSALFLKLEFAKLILLSTGTVLPAFLISLATFSVYEAVQLNRDLRRGIKNKPDFYTKLTNALLVTDAIYFFWLLYAYMHHDHSMHTFVYRMSFSVWIIPASFLLYDLVSVGYREWRHDLELKRMHTTVRPKSTVYNTSMATNLKKPTKKQFFDALKKVARKQKSGTSKTKT